MILRATQKVAPHSNVLQVIWDFANYVAIPTEAISHSPFFHFLERLPVVTLFFRYQDVNFSNGPHATCAPGCFSATQEPQTPFVLHRCIKQRSLALNSSLLSGHSPLHVQFWASGVEKGGGRAANHTEKVISCDFEGCGLLKALTLLECTVTFCTELFCESSEAPRAQQRAAPPSTSFNS